MQLPTYTCLRCGHTWVPRVPHKPRRCPNCKDSYWDRPRKAEAEKKEN
jgi:predicted Zn-ribbon and HTH transcriptional regulator